MLIDHFQGGRVSRYTFAIFTLSFWHSWADASTCGRLQTRELIEAVQDHWIYKTVTSESSRRRPELMQTVAQLEQDASTLLQKIGQDKIANSLVDGLETAIGRRLRGTARDVMVTEAVLVVLGKISSRADLSTAVQANILGVARDVLEGHGQVERLLPIVRQQALDYLNDSVTNTHPFEREALGVLGSYNDR